MSDRDNPFNPFGRAERTIVRPNPGGRRPAPAAPPIAPIPPLPQGPAAAPPPQAPYPQQPYPPQPQPPQAAPAAPAPPWPGPAPPPTAGQEEDWVSARRPPPPPPQAPPRGPVLARRDILTAPNENPVMRAAAPLLLLLGRLRVGLSRAAFAHLLEQVAAAIEDFEKDVLAAGVPAAQARVAKYLVAATADDIVQNLPGEDRHVWTQYSMLSRFFGERIGGVRFFEEVDRAKVDPVVNYPLLELAHACLALGFQGIHRTAAGGAATLQQIQRNLYETLRRARPKIDNELSPHWRGLALALKAVRLEIPAWAVGSVVAALLFGFYLVLRFLLSGQAEAVAAATLALHPTTEISLQRRVFAPPPPPPPPPPPTSQAKRIRDGLGDDRVQVAEAANVIVVRLANLALFGPGDATVRDEFKPLIARIAAALEKEPGAIKIVGHTDSAPISNVRFPSNFHLSVARAKAVAALIKPHLSQPDRIETEGKGADMPIAPNNTAEGRAKNRRVEILVPRSG